MASNGDYSTGTHKKWSWIVREQHVYGLSRLLIQFHPGSRLCITAFDFGHILPDREDSALGWVEHDGVMVSPPLSPNLKIPTSQFDEWYLVGHLPSSLDFSEPFLSNGEFTLVSPGEVIAKRDNTWESVDLDTLGQMQAIFWRDMERLDVVCYAASGDVDIVVTTQPDLIDYLRQSEDRSI